MPDVEQLLSQFPGPVTLPAKPRDWRWAALFSVAAGILLLTQAISGAVAGTERFFAATVGLLLLALAAALLWMQRRLPPHRNQLVLDRDGFAWHHAGEDARIGWREITGVRVYAMDMIYDLTGTGNVEYLFKPGPGEASDVERFGALPNRYGFRASQLARLMNEWRARALGEQTPGR